MKINRTCQGQDTEMVVVMVVLNILIHGPVKPRRLFRDPLPYLPHCEQYKQQPTNIITTSVPNKCIYDMKINAFIH
jgi:hypothetical protein